MRWQTNVLTRKNQTSSPSRASCANEEPRRLPCLLSVCSRFPHSSCALPLPTSVALSATDPSSPFSHSRSFSLYPAHSPFLSFSCRLLLPLCPFSIFLLSLLFSCLPSFLPLPSTSYLILSFLLFARLLSMSTLFLLVLLLLFLCILTVASLHTSSSPEFPAPAPPPFHTNDEMRASQKRQVTAASKVKNEMSKNPRGHRKVQKLR